MGVLEALKVWASWGRGVWAGSATALGPAPLEPPRDPPELIFLNSSLEVASRHKSFFPKCFPQNFCMEIDLWQCEWVWNSPYILCQLNMTIC